MNTLSVEAGRRTVMRPLAALCRVVLGLGILNGLLFGSAGRFDLPFASSTKNGIDPTRAAG